MENSPVEFTMNNINARMLTISHNNHYFPTGLHSSLITINILDDFLNHSGKTLLPVMLSQTKQYLCVNTSETTSILTATALQVDLGKWKGFECIPALTRFLLHIADIEQLCPKVCNWELPLSGGTSGNLFLPVIFKGHIQTPLLWQIIIKWTLDPTVVDLGFVACGWWLSLFTSGP